MVFDEECLLLKGNPWGHSTESLHNQNLDDLASLLKPDGLTFFFLCPYILMQIREDEVCSPSLP